ncbi:hypothetical protein [Actinosynnema mirum]|uniref:Uncharacterized protein n=1 Tax=Actinosynnema mirum (strain ATCC 29888 / DSM 43827 / JCM 3225 / NBRC 14064 / NCIMB 13271 / NRRL B-12336 / IMRU 3971 / 101) TaxID=446462 RepID=C6WET5_ACTMD|nr:hypothetical protein [Actinosynnema mirum]ACU39710.1 hypothetical protein Amir_5901 [Actinosynnema mirum DSM 43827]
MKVVWLQRALWGVLALLVAVGTGLLATGPGGVAFTATWVSALVVVVALALLAWRQVHVLKAAPMPEGAVARSWCAGVLGVVPVSRLTGGLQVVAGAESIRVRFPAAGNSYSIPVADVRGVTIEQRHIQVVHSARRVPRTVRLDMRAGDPTRDAIIDLAHGGR